MEYEFSRLLLSPVCMGPSKLVEFWGAAHNFIKYDDSGTLEPDIIEFRNNDLNIWPIELIIYKLFGDETQWDKVLPNSDWELFKKDGGGMDGRNTTQVTRLLRLIRNKWQHPKKCGLQLGWFSNGIVSDKPDNYLFARYWITRFPRLTPFLYHQFQKQRASLSEFYPEWLYEQTSEVKWFVTAEDFVIKMQEACTNQLNLGLVEERFEMSDGFSTKTVELRTLPGRLLTKLLNNDDMLDIIVSEDKVAFRRDNETLEYKVNNVGCDKRCTYIFVHTIDSNRVQAILSVNTESHNRIIVFTHSDMVQSIADKFGSTAGCKDEPVCFHDLLKSTQLSVLLGKIEVQCKEFYLKDFLPTQQNILSEFLPQIKGNVLNTLLKNQTLFALSKCPLPDINQFYFIRRHLRHRDILCSELRTERDFIVSIEKRDKRFFLISGQPGMGKSALVNQMANICGNVRGAIALKIVMKQFVENLAKTKGDLIKEEISSDDVISNIAYMARSTIFDGDFLQMLLKSHKQRFCKPKIYLFFDGIDETKPEFIRLAAEMLKLLNLEYRSLPIIATVRDHLLDEVEIYCGILAYRLQPLKRCDQFQFQKTIWCDYIQSRVAAHLNPDNQFDVNVKRKLYPLKMVHSSILNSASDQEIFVLITTESEQMEITEEKEYEIEKLDFDSLLFSQLDVHEGKYVYHYIAEDDIEIMQIPSIIEYRNENLQFCHCPTHFLKYVRKDIFEMIGTLGRVLISKAIEERECAYFDASAKLSPVKEENFLKNLNPLERTIILWEEPTISVSLLLLNWASIFKRSSTVLLLRMSDLIDHLPSIFLTGENVDETKELIMDAIFKSANSLSSYADFASDSSIHLEIFIDGIDYSLIETSNGFILFHLLDKINCVLKAFLNLRLWMSFKLSPKLFENVWDKLGVRGYRVEPLTELEEAEYLKIFWREQMNSYEKGKSCIVLEIFTLFSQQCLMQLFQNNVDNAGVPLQIQMATEILESEVYNLNLCFRTDSKSTLYHLCKQLVEKKYNIYLYENLGIAPKFSLESMPVKGTRLIIDNKLKFFALQEIFSEEVAEKFSYELDIPDCVDERQTILDELLAHGIVRYRFPPMFPHLTLAEYYVAEFIVRFLRMFHPIGKKNLELVENDKSANFTWNTIFSYNESTQKLKYLNICFFINASLEDKFVVFRMDKGKTLKYNGNKDLFQAPKISQEFVNNMQKYLCKAPKISQGFVNNIHKNLYLMKAINQSKFSTLESFLIYLPNNFLVVFLNSLVSLYYEYIEYLMKTFGHNGELFTRLHNLHSNGYGVLHWFLCGMYLYHVCNGDAPFKEPEIKKTLKKLVFDDEGRARSVIEEANARGQTPLLFLINTMHQSTKPFDMSLHTFFVNELHANINATDNAGNSMLHFNHYILADLYYLRSYHSDLLGHYGDMVKFFLEKGTLNPDLINSKNSWGLTPIQSFLHYIIELRKQVVYGYKQLCCLIKEVIDTFHEHQADFNIPDVDGDSAFLNLVEIVSYSEYKQEDIRDDGIKLLEYFISCGINLNGVNEEGQNALHFAVMNDSMDVVKYLVRVNPSLLRSVDTDGRALISYAETENIRNLLRVLYSISEGFDITRKYIMTWTNGPMY